VKPSWKSQHERPAPSRTTPKSQDERSGLVDATLHFHLERSVLVDGDKNLRTPVV